MKPFSPRPLACLLLGAALSACGVSAPAVPVAPAPVEPEPVEAAPPPPEAEPLPEPEPPPPLPEAPRGSIESRSLYPQIRAASWTLANGLRVVVKQTEGGPFILTGRAPQGTGGLDTPEAARLGAAVAGATWDGLAVTLSASGLRFAGEAEGLDDAIDVLVGVLARGPKAWAPPDGPPVALSPTDAPMPLPDLSPAEGAALAQAVLARPEAFTVVLVGPADPEAVEGVVGRALAGLPPRRGAALGSGQTAARLGAPRALEGDGGSSFVEVRAPASWTDLPAILVTQAVLRERAESASVRLDPEGGLVEARASTEAAVDALFGPASEADVRDARAALRRAPARAWADALTALFAEPGDWRPARRPEAAADAVARAEAVSVEAVNALLRRLAESPSRATFLARP